MKWVTVSGIQRWSALLECPACGREAEHEVRYVGGLLHVVECSQCGQRLEVQHSVLERAYLQGLTVRIVTKPIRMGLEAKRNPLRFARSLPRRLVTKPPRMAGEVAEVIGLRGHQ
jgi:hypothetical protein